MGDREEKECDQHRNNRDLAGNDNIWQGRFLTCIGKSFKHRVYQQGSVSVMADLFNSC